MFHFFVYSDVAFSFSTRWRVAAQSLRSRLAMDLESPGDNGVQTSSSRLPFRALGDLSIRLFVRFLPEQVHGADEV